ASATATFAGEPPGTARKRSPSPSSTRSITASPATTISASALTPGSRFAPLPAALRWSRAGRLRNDSVGADHAVGAYDAVRTHDAVRTYDAVGANDAVGTDHTGERWCDRQRRDERRLVGVIDVGLATPRGPGRLVVRIK